MEKPRSGTKYKTLVVLGSGGHTTEMLRLLAGISKCPEFARMEISFVVAGSDTTSLARIPSILPDIPLEVITIPRLRHVGESVFRALLRAPFVFLTCIHAVWNSKPDLILTNGPGTCIPIVVSNVLLEVCGLKTRSVSVFIESFCRVRTVSQTGKILAPLVDSFILQWPPREGMHGKYLGVLIYLLGVKGYTVLSSARRTVF